jgi:hypothetical protein
MMTVSPLGYPAKERSEVDRKLRSSVRGDERLPAEELFFEGSFSTPLREPGEALEAVRWAPSAANRQPWRVVKDGDAFHFYKKHTTGFTAGASWAVQKIDLGIALCHFIGVTGGQLGLADPGITVSGDTEYIATVTVPPAP